MRDSGLGVTWAEYVSKLRKFDQVVPVARGARCHTKWFNELVI